MSDRSNRVDIYTVDGLVNTGFSLQRSIWPRLIYVARAVARQRVELNVRLTLTGEKPVSLMYGLKPTTVAIRQLFNKHL